MLLIREIGSNTKKIYECFCVCAGYKIDFVMLLSLMFAHMREMPVVTGTAIREQMF